MGLITNESYDYWRISDGMVRKTTTEDDPLAIKRVLKKDDGSEKTMYEQVNKGISGVVDTVEIREGKYGRQLYIGITDGAERFFLQVPWESPYSRTFLERLPAVDMSKDVSIMPYSFEKDGKRRSGVALYQDEVKIGSYYKEYSEDFTSTKHLHGYPQMTDGMDSDDYKIVGVQQMKFLKEKVVDQFPFFEKDEPKKEPTGKSDKKDDLPFG